MRLPSYKLTLTVSLLFIRANILCTYAPLPACLGLLAEALLISLLGRFLSRIARLWLIPLAALLLDIQLMTSFAGGDLLGLPARLGPGFSFSALAKVFDFIMLLCTFMPDIAYPPRRRSRRARIAGLALIAFGLLAVLIPGLFIHDIAVLG